MKILHCPSDVGGNAWALSRAERRLGLDSTVMVYQRSWFKYNVDIDLRLDKHSPVLSMFRLLSAIAKAATEYDVIHYNFGSSLVPYGNYPEFVELCDLPVLRKLGKKIVVTYQGCDARQRSYFSRHFDISACREADCYAEICNNDQDLVKERRIKKFGRYAHKIFSLNPDLLHVLPSQAEFLPYTCVDLDEWQPSIKPRSNTPITIVHSPTNRGAKGSRYIEEAISKLKKDGREINFITVENMPHDQVRHIYEKADVAIDQLLIGWYGAFAVEMMALGKPVICYIRDEDLKFIPPEMAGELPIINANPGTVYDVLKRVIAERESLLSIGGRSRSYVERWHDPLKIAMRTKAVYEGLKAQS